jgi:hypothetical protein
MRVILSERVSNCLFAWFDITTTLYTKYDTNMVGVWVWRDFTNGTSEWSIKDIPELGIALHLDVCTRFMYA